MRCKVWTEYYCFENAILREVTYELIPVNQRKMLHAHLASVLDSHVMMGNWSQSQDPFSQNQMDNMAEHYFQGSSNLEDEALACTCTPGPPRFLGFRV